MKTKILLYFIPIYVLLTNPLFSQWTIYNSQNSPLIELFSTGCINQDSNGLYWIYQESGGFYRFDGIAQWEHFENIFENFGISDIILPYVVGTIGNIWWGISGGLLNYNAVKQNGNNFRVITGYNSMLPKELGKVNGIAVDKNNILWLATRDKGVLKYDVINNTVTEYNKENTSLTTNTIQDILIDNQGNLWGICGSSSVPPKDGFIPSLFKYDENKWTVYTPLNSGFGIGIPRALAFDSTGNIWIGGLSDIQKFDNVEWTLYGNTLNTLCLSKGFNVMDLDIDKNNNLWVSSFSKTCGILKFDGNLWSNFNKNNSELPDDNILRAYVDHENRIWMGLSKGGVAVYENEPLSVENYDIFFKDIKLEQNIPNPFNGTTEIKCIIPEKYGKNIQLVITNGTGLQELKKFDLEPVIENNIKVSASDFVTGAYIYGISINGVIVKSKKMMIIK